MNNKAPDKPEFGKIRAFFWPIYMDELKKFLPMGMMMFFILFNYSLLRVTKDSLVVPAAGPEVIPYLKGFVVLPISILFVVLYAKLVNVFSRETNFYMIVLVFTSFFLFFGFYLYPNLDMVHPDPASIVALQTDYPIFKPIFSIYGLWTYSIFYLLAELWGGVMLALLFWQFANEITRTREAKRFYAMFGLLANFALLGAMGYSLFMKYIIRPTLEAGVDKWGVDLIYSMTLVSIASLCVMLLYRWMHKSVLTDPKYYDAAEDKGPKKAKKPKLSVWDSFKYILSSKYLGLIAVLIIGYGISINLIELVWKAQIKAQYPAPDDFRDFMAFVQGLTGIATIFLILCLKGIVQKMGWFVSAVITPVMILVTGFLLFAFVIFTETMAPFAVFFGVTPVLMAVVIGTIQQVLSKGTKYSLFDPTKEMTYIPLDQESKTKGKAAVDVIGGRLGKASGGYIAIGLFTIFGQSVSVISVYLAIIVVLIIGLWIIAVKGLSTMYTGLRAAKKEVDKAEGLATK